ncbi:MAG: MFS transporter [Rhodanobacteraceae bacterium]
MQDAADRSHWKRTLAVLGVMAASFAFQETGVLPVLPTIQRQLSGASTTSSALLESGFLIVAAVAAPLIGKYGDARGKQRMLLVTLAIYFIGAIGAGMAPNFIVLVIFRALQGAGGALFSLSFAVMRDEAPERLNVAIGVLVGSFGVGSSLGFGFSGLITQLLSWRYIFFAEAVLMVVVAALVAKFVPRSPERHDVSVDYPGVALLGASLAMLIISLTFLLMLGWKVIGGFALFAVLFALWIWRERRAEQPLLDIGILTRPQVLLPNLGSGLAGYVAFSTFFLVPRFVEVPRHLAPHVARHMQYGFAADPTAIGLFLLPVGVGVLWAGPFGGVLGRRIGGKWPFVAGLGILVLASALLATVHQEPYEFAVWLFLVGTGFGLSIGAAGVFVTQAVGEHQTGIANAFNSLTRLVFGGIGAQIAAIIMKSQHVTGSSAPYQSAFAVAFAICAVLAAVGTGLAVIVPSERKATGRQTP